VENERVFKQAVRTMKKLDAHMAHVEDQLAHAVAMAREALLLAYMAETKCTITECDLVCSETATGFRIYVRSIHER